MVGEPVGRRRDSRPRLLRAAGRCFRRAASPRAIGAASRRLGPVDIDIRQGEIVGIAGGRRQWSRTNSSAAWRAFSLLTPARSGFAGVDLAGAPAAAFRAAGIGYVSADRARGRPLPPRLDPRQFHRRSRGEPALRAPRDGSTRLRSTRAHRRRCECSRCATAAYANPRRTFRAAISNAWLLRANLIARQNCWSRRSRRAASTSPAWLSSIAQLAAFRDRGGAVLLGLGGTRRVAGAVGPRRRDLTAASSSASSPRARPTIEPDRPHDARREGGMTALRQSKRCCARRRCPAPFVIALVIGALVLAATGYDPLDVYRLMVEEAFGGERRIASTLTAATPLLLTGARGGGRFSRRRLQRRRRGLLLSRRARRRAARLRARRLAVAAHHRLRAPCGRARRRPLVVRSGRRCARGSASTRSSAL